MTEPWFVAFIGVPAAVVAVLGIFAWGLGFADRPPVRAMKKVTVSRHPR